jgi:hypothetical protein
LLELLLCIGFGLTLCRLFLLSLFLLPAIFLLLPPFLLPLSLRLTG